jgi:hypothetical protein
MKLRYLFTINIFIAILIGLSCSLLPGWLLRLYGLVPDDASIWVTRLVGGSILGYATLMWFGRRTESIQTRRAIALALFIQDVIGLAASVEIQLRGSINFLGWPLNILTYGLLALGYAYFYFFKPNNC